MAHAGLGAMHHGLRVRSWHQVAFVGVLAVGEDLLDQSPGADLDAADPLEDVARLDNLFGLNLDV